jgi:Ni2+-binding GTPase involved in maturation of urease and hydrogenase
VGRKAEREGQYSSAIKAYSDILGYIQAKPRAPLVAIESKGNLVFKWQDEVETTEEAFIIDQTSGDRD